MPRKRSAPTAALSSELGDCNDFATSYTSKGRAIRKCRNRTPILDVEAESDDDHDDYDDLSDEIAVAPLRKKKKRALSLSPTRDVPNERDLEASEVSSDDDTIKSQSPSGHMTVHLTVNIPLNHQGPITLNLDPKFTPVPDKLTQATLARINARSKPKSRSAGFLDLPAELKNVIYREVFVTDRPLRFGSPGKSLSRSSALLRTCRQVHEEGRSILYSENTFTVERRCDRIGSLWDDNWKEMGFYAVRKFFKSIGSANTGLIRHLNFVLEDAVPCLNPATMTNEERRFVNDDELLSILRHLIQHSQLQTMKIHFNGRRRVERGDDRFLNYMRRVRADQVEFVTQPLYLEYARDSKQDNSVKDSLLASCARKRKKFDR